MKKHVWILAAVMMIYSVSYLIIRFQLHDSTDSSLLTDSGVKHIHQERTFIWIPGVGAGRIAKQMLYWCFYPVGQIDHLVTGRVYDCTDQRNLEI